MVDRKVVATDMREREGAHEPSRNGDSSLKVPKPESLGGPNSRGKPGLFR
jgi:hypothetical protein